MATGAPTNWAGNISYTARAVHQPASLSELHEVITQSSSLRCLGSRHSFNRIADGSEIIDMTTLPEFLELGRDRDTVTVNGAMTYGRLAELLAPLGFAVHNLASLPHISIAGAIATGTHGSGDRNGNLASGVAGLQIMTGSGDIVQVRRGDPDWDGHVVSLGALGAVTSVTLDIEPSFDVEQRVYDGPSLASLAERFDEIFGAAYSVSAFTDWRGGAQQIWVKHRVGEPAEQITGLAEATGKRHPLIGLDPQACTEQSGAPGPWWDRLPHFRLEFTPSAGEEIQSEFFVGRADAASAIEALERIGGAIAEALLVSEVRTVAEDSMWMSPHHGRPSVAFHFTWVRDEQLASDAAGRVADALAPFDPRPHWGKLFDDGRVDVAAAYPRRDDFLALVERTDARGVFRNRWFDDVIG